VTFALSFLDQGPASAESPPSVTVRRTEELASLAERLGFHRFWVAEHHGVPNMAIAAPEVLVAHLAARTTRLRIGSGGVMLPNHAPLQVAERFRMLEALHPGRIDLGIGRSTGTGDAVTHHALLREPDGLTTFDRDLARLLAVADVQAHSSLPPDDPYHELTASPSDVALSSVFLLGSSVRSAEAAARLGLGYAFFSAYQPPETAVTALRRYREVFAGPRPHAVLALRAWVGEDDEHAEALAMPERRAVLDHHTGARRALDPVEVALARPLTEAQRAVQERLDDRSDVVGGVAAVEARLARLVATTGADEVMVVSNVHDPVDRQAVLARLAIAAGLCPQPGPTPRTLATSG
jgi:luciferase family oxidoreductase group 1